ncbi:Exopolyphosphatase [hydrothermal vent metagenome]|uniref:Exopolyphosphatase n=1 Tax=hydrothermal vent metagenome TaxID=652676 RepID=A0A3B1BC23_9ZZZZ
MSRIAAIDLGTNTVRILVVDVNGEGGYSPLFSGQTVTRLGQGLHETGSLAPEAIKRTTDGVAELIKRADSFAPFSLTITATSAGREAANSEALDAMIRSATGHGIKIISGDEEARLSLKGVQLAIDDDDFILIDVGGGSTEFIFCKDGTLAKVYNSNLGVVRLCETYLTKHPVIEKEYNEMTSEIDRVVNEAFNHLDAGEGAMLVGTAGTITSLAAIAMGMVDYSPAKINNYRLTDEMLESLRLKLSALTIEERSHMPILRGGREDLIIPGVAIVQSVIKRFGSSQMVVSDYGLREGLIMELMEK